MAMRNIMGLAITIKKAILFAITILKYRHLFGSSLGNANAAS